MALLVGHPRHRLAGGNSKWHAVSRFANSVWKRSSAKLLGSQQHDDVGPAI